MVFQKLVVIDGRGHLMGRLASVIAKELLMGQRVVVVRAEGIDMSGSIIKNKIKFDLFLNKKNATNPRKHGPFHEHSPAEMFKRVVRGMLPRKTARGKQAILKLKVVEGIPKPFDKMKRQVVPSALRALRLMPGRKYTNLGELAHLVGWKYRDLITKLEDKRKAESNTFYLHKKQAKKLQEKATKSIKLNESSQQILAKFGYN